VLVDLSNCDSGCGGVVADVDGRRNETPVIQSIAWFGPATNPSSAIRLAADAGLTVVSGWCTGATRARLGLGPGQSLGDDKCSNET
jgi:hypothetical protein